MTDVLTPATDDPERPAPSKARTVGMPPGSRTRSGMPWGHEIALVAAALAIYVWFVAATIHHATHVYLPPDGAHYLGEADTLLGRGVLTFIHPPAFAALVALCRAVIGSEFSGILAAIVTALALAYLGLYVLARQWMPTTAAILGTSVGMLLPITGELVGWSAGTTILGLAFGLLSMAAFERWSRTGAKYGTLVGLALALTVLAHPFAFLVTGLCIAVRWAVQFHPTRRITRDSSPFGLLGVVSVVVPLAAASLFTLTYYGQVESPRALGLGPPASGTLNQLLRWATPDNGLLLFVSVAALGTAFWATTAGATAISGTLAALIVVVPTFVRVDVTYLSRVMYYIPVLVALAVGFAWLRLTPWAKRQFDARRRVALAGVVALTLLVFTATTGFRLHTTSAIGYYGRLAPDDVQFFQRFPHGGGTVATSWSRNDYASGDSSSWYVSGLAKRRAVGPAGPWLVTRASERRTGQDMQRFFAGRLGVDNNSVQVTSLPSVVSAGRIGIQTTVTGIERGFFFPLLALNPGGPRYPEEIPGAEHFPVPVGPPVITPTSTGLRVVYSGSGGSPAIAGIITVSGQNIRVRYRSIQSVPGAWRLTLRPTSGAPWAEQHATANDIALTQPVAGHQITSDVRVDTPRAEIGLVTLDPITNTTELVISTGNTTGVEFTIKLRGTDTPSRMRSFTGRTLIDAYTITDIVIFKNANITQRFSADPCFRETAESSSLIAFAVKTDCL